MTLRTRFAPSPTGVLHLGSARTALFNYLFAKRFGGQFLLRIEDTDRERSTAQNVEAIFDAMQWLGLDFSEEPQFQSARRDRYHAVIEHWLESGKAYRCYCSRERLDELRDEQRRKGEHVRYDGRCRSLASPVAGVEPVIRFRNPEGGSVIVDDVVRGQVEFSNAQLDDLIIARSDGSPTYNFCVVVDDFEMGITHVIRGDDHLNNTPRQANMLEALGAPRPVYAHIPMILGPDGAKLSKRHGAVDIREYRDQGFFPEAMLNYLVRLGWSHGDQEVFTVAEMTELFDIADVNHSASSFNPEKLVWVNRQHMAMKTDAELGAELTPFLNRRGYDLANGPRPETVAKAFRERSDNFDEMAAQAAFCFADFADFDETAAKKHLRPVILEPLKALQEKLAGMEAWTAASIRDAIQRVADSFGINLGKLGQPLRVAVSGSGMSPPIDLTVELVGKRRALDRLGRAIEYIARRAALS